MKQIHFRLPLGFLFAISVWVAWLVMPQPASGLPWLLNTVWMQLPTAVQKATLQDSLGPLQAGEQWTPAPAEATLLVGNPPAGTPCQWSIYARRSLWKVEARMQGTADGQFYLRVWPEDEGVRSTCALAPADLAAKQAQPKPTALAPGEYLVGTEILPGRYIGGTKNPAGSHCLWQRQMMAGIGPDGNLDMADRVGAFIVTVQKTDQALTTTCPLELLTP